MKRVLLMLVWLQQQLSAALLYYLIGTATVHVLCGAHQYCCAVLVPAHAHAHIMMPMLMSFHGCCCNALLLLPHTADGAAQE
jgi:hypothetical protein